MEEKNENLTPVLYKEMSGNGMQGNGFGGNGVVEAEAFMLSEDEFQKLVEDLI